MTKLDNHKVGLALGAVIATMHLVWIVLVLLSLAQPLLNFIFWAHLMTNPLSVTGFDLMAAMTLLVVTFGVGYGVGGAFAYSWNYFQRR